MPLNKQKEQKVTAMNRKEVVKTILATAKLLAAATPSTKVSAGAGYLALLDQVLGVISTDELEGMRKDLVKLKKEVADSQDVTRKLEDKVQGIVEQISDELDSLSEDLTEDDKVVVDVIAKLKDMPSSRATESVLEGSTLSAATLPEVNANGTDKSELLKNYNAAVAACRQLMNALDACWPNARDYPAGQYAKARDEHQMWMKQAKEMGIELYEIVDAIESAAKQPGRFG